MDTLMKGTLDMKRKSSSKGKVKKGATKKSKGKKKKMGYGY